MASKRDRQRKLERARAERRVARQAYKVRRRRQVQATVGASFALVLVIFMVVFVVKPFSHSTPQAGGCVWNPINAATNPNVTDVGTPPTSGGPTTGFENMTIGTNLGDITVELNLDNAPCAAASFTYLGSKGFFANSSCSRLSGNLLTLQCGDPKSNGSGGPAYQFADEYIPQTPITPSASASVAPTSSASATASSTASPTYYKRGDVVLVNTGANTNGSQFYIIYADNSPLTNAYTLIGTVTGGMDIVDRVVKDGAIGDNGKPAKEGKPKTTLTFQSLIVGPETTPTASPSATATPTGTAKS